MTADEFRALKPGDKVTLLRYGVASAWGTIREIKPIERGEGLSLTWFDWIGTGPVCLLEWQAVGDDDPRETLALGHVRPPGVVFDDEPRWHEGMPDKPGVYWRFGLGISVFVADHLADEYLRATIGNVWFYGPLPEPPKEDACLNS